jgi:diguanylate cyclase (GGDEF)-like protein
VAWAGPLHQPAARTIRRSRVCSALLWVVAVLCAVFVASLLLRERGTQIPLYDAWIGNAIYVLAAALCLGRARRDPDERWAWALIATGLLGWAVGTAYYTILIEQHGGGAPPFPSVADAIWLLNPSCPLIGTVLLVRVRLGRIPRHAWLDALVAGFGLVACAAVVLVPAMRASAHDSVLATAVALAYPTSHLLMLGFLAGTSSLRGWQGERSWWLLVAGLAVNALGDLQFTRLIVADGYLPVGLLDGVWRVGSVLVAMAAVSSGGQGRRGAAAARVGAAVPVVITLACVGLLAAGNVWRLDRVTVALALAAASVAAARTGLVMRYVRQAQLSRTEARTDELTGMANRRHLYETMAAIVPTATAAQPVALLLLDLDRFKDVNDTLGHQVGDEVLTLVSERLARNVTHADTVARLGGDEFAVILTSLPGDPFAAAAAVAERLRSLLDEPVHIQGVRIRSGASVGIAIAPFHASDPHELLQHADVAMYQAKARRTGLAVYDAASDQHNIDRLELAEDLRTALVDDQLVVHYQPKHDLRCGRPVGVEALVRWRHPSRGLLYPDAFLPTVEQTNLMDELTVVVLRKALRQLAEWRAGGHDLLLSVNVSALSLLDDGFPEVVAELLRETGGIPPATLVLEITEHTLMSDPATALDILRRLRALGVRLSIDDYGTGYSSLSYLGDLPIHELKIDRTFVQRLTTDPKAAAIVESTVGLGHALGLEVVAEGVEDEAILGRLRDLGCDLAQGYHLGRPVPAEDLALGVAARTR